LQKVRPKILTVVDEEVDMSRYQIPGTRFVYGFDRPLSEYFLDEGSKGIVGTLGRLYGDATNLYTELKRRELWDKIPESHRNAIAGDEPF
jgi:hypothetical protein